MAREGWTLRAWREQGVLVVSARGVATAESLRMLRTFIAVASKEHGARAILVDFRECQPEMNLGDWRQAAADSASAGLTTPIAMVVPERYFDVVVQYCVSVAMRGLTRMAFMSYEPALSWCQFEIDRLGVAPAESRPAALSRTRARLRLVHQGS